MARIRNIGIVAHVDAGKTTITENILFKTGAIRSLGSVDKGSTLTDDMSIEQERGITIRSASVSTHWKGEQINFIDTPGHADFSAEVDRILSVLDGVVLVLSAVEGIQAHTFSLWQALQKMKIPVLIFINKIDRQGADFSHVVEDLNKEFDPLFFPLYSSLNEESNEATIQGIWNGNEHFLKENLLEEIVQLDEYYLNRYFENESLLDEEVIQLIEKLTKKQAVCPIYTGVAKFSIGIEELLDGIIDFIPPFKPISSQPSALVFKVEQDKTHGRLAHIKLLSGTLKNRDKIKNDTQNTEEKIAQIKKKYTKRLEDIGELTAGDIGIVTGMSSIMAGDVLGSPDHLPKSYSINTPILTVQVKPVDSKDYQKLGESLLLLNSESPDLDFTWYKEEKELHLLLMGAMQIEILQALILERFEINALFEQPSVIYKETITQSTEGYARYWMPKPCWAILNLTMEPGENGSGIVFESKIGVNDVAKKYQNEIEKTIPKALKQGIRGWEVTDIKITLSAGEDHEMHSRPGDFIIATPMAIMDGLQKNGTQLLEPVLSFFIQAPEEFLGKIAGDLTQRQAIIQSPDFEGNNFSLSGSVPASQVQEYSIFLNSITSGRGRVLFQLNGYQPCLSPEGKDRAYKGVNPLDESQWILHARGAYKANDRKL